MNKVCGSLIHINSSIVQKLQESRIIETYNIFCDTLMLLRFYLVIPETSKVEDNDLGIGEVVSNVHNYLVFC